MPYFLQASFRASAYACATLSPSDCTCATFSVTSYSGSASVSAGLAVSEVLVSSGLVSKAELLPHPAKSATIKAAAQRRARNLSFFMVLLPFFCLLLFLSAITRREFLHEAALPRLQDPFPRGTSHWRSFGKCRSSPAHRHISAQHEHGNGARYLRTRRD